MTATDLPDDRADVIEAATGITDSYLIGTELQGSGSAIVEALAAAGLLVSSVAQDEDCDARIFRWGKRHEERAERAEAERDLLRAQVAAVRDEEYAVNEAVGWDDRKSLADAFQDGGGHLASLDGDVYAGLVQVAKHGARWAYRHAHEDDTAGGEQHE